MNDIKAYKIAFNLRNYACPVVKNERIWVLDIVVKWEWFAKKHIGGPELSKIVVL